jgi:outer membrane protein
MKIRFADILSRRGFVTALGALTGGGVASVAVAQPAAAKPADTGGNKVGVIDFQGAIAATAEGKAGLAALQSQFAPRNNELQQLSKKVDDLNAQLRAGQNTLSDEEKARIQNQISQAQQSGQRKLQDLQDDQQAAEQELIQTIGAKMVDIVDKYSQDNGYTMVLDGGSQTSTVVWAAQSANITQAVVTAYDAGHSEKSSSPSSAPSTTPRSTAPKAPSGTTAPKQ